MNEFQEGSKVEIAGIGPGIITYIENNVPTVAYSLDGKFLTKEFPFDQLTLKSN